MKKIFLMIFVLALLLSACAMLPTATTVPTQESTVAPTVTPTSEEIVIFSWPGTGEIATPLPTAKPGEGINMRQLYEKYFARVGSSVPEVWNKGAIMEFTKPYVEGSGRLEVTINGNPETIIKDVSCQECNQVFYFSGWKEMGTGQLIFDTEDLFQNWYVENPSWNGYSNTVYIFPSGYGYMNLTMTSEIWTPTPVEDISEWEGTKATLLSWEHPDGLIVNHDTDEVAGPGLSVLTIDDDHKQAYFYPKARMWGYIHIETDRYSGGRFIILTQSEPDPDVFERTQKYMEENYPDEQYYGPYDTCNFIADSTYNLDESQQVLEEELIDLCGVFYSDGNLNY